MSFATKPLSRETRTGSGRGIASGHARLLGTSAALTIVLASFGAALTPANAATFSVTSNADSGAGTLRQALLDANGSAGADIIEVDAGLTIVVGAEPLPAINESLTINGNGATIDGDTSNRVFFIQSGDVELSDMTIANGAAAGGAGSQGGGGGMGAGGAIFVNAGSTTVTNVNFQTNSATGGDGGDDTRGPAGGSGGGGGGLGGSGGVASDGAGGGGGYSGGGGGGGGADLTGLPSSNFLGGDGGDGPGGAGGTGGSANPDLAGQPGVNGGSGGAAPSGTDLAGGGGGGGGLGGGDGGDPDSALPSDDFGGGGGGGGGLTGTGGDGADGYTGASGGGDGTVGGGGGGAGASAAGAGGDGGDFGGGGGGSGDFAIGDNTSDGGDGGYGGGGGGSGGHNEDTSNNSGSFSGNGGNGGFGAGGGGGFAGGVGGIGGGDGGVESSDTADNLRGAGGGGGGLGGAVFVREGASLTINDSTFNGSAVTAGAAGGDGSDGATGGQAGGGDLFLQSGTTTFGGTGTTTMTQTVVDESALTGGAGTASILKTGTGTVALEGDVDIAGTATVENGILALSGSNSFGGGIVVGGGGAGTQGTLSLLSNDAAGGATGTITTLGSVIDYGNGVDMATPIELNSDDTQLQVLTGSAEQSGVISEDASSRPLEKIGDGTLVLSAANTYTGQTTISAGTLAVTGAGSIASTAVSVVGTLVTDSDALAAGATVTVSGTGTFTSSGTDSYTGITQTGGTVNGTGVQTLSGAFNQSGGTTGGSVDINATTFTQSGGATIAAGTTVTSSGAQTLQGGAIAGTLDGAGAVTVSTGTTSLTGAGAITVASTIGIDAGGTLTSDGNGINDAATVTNGGVFTITGAETIGGLRGSGTTNLTGANLTTGNASINTYSGTIQGNGGLVVQGTNETALSGTNTFSGGTTVNSGTLSLANNASNLSDTGLVTVNAPGTLLLVGDETIGAVQGSGTVDIFSGILTTGDATDTTLSGNITGAGSLVKEGTGTFTVSGNVATNATVNDGTLALSGNNTMTSITVDGDGRLRLLSNNAAGGAAGQITTTGSVVSYGNGVNSATPILLNSDDTQLEVLAADAAEQSGVISETGGSRPIEKIGTGTLTLSAANTYTGQTTVTAGTLNVTGSIASAAVVVQGGASLGVDGASLLDTASVTLNGDGNMTLTGNETIGSLAGASNTATVTLNANTLTTGGNNATTSFAGVIDGAGGLTKAGTGTMTLTGNNTYAGATAVDGGTLVAGSSNALGSTAGGTTVAAGATLALQGNIFLAAEPITLNGTGVGGGGALRNLSSDNTVSGAITLATDALITSDANQLTLSGGITGANTNLTLGGAGNILVGSAITTGAGTLTKNGTGIAALTGINTFTGNTNINGGALQANSGSALSDTGLVTIASGALLQVFVSETVGSIAGAGGIDLGAGLTTGGDNTSTDFAGVIGGAGGLTKVGTGTFTLSGANTFTGDATVNGGTLAVTGGAAIADTVEVVVGSGATFRVDWDEEIGALTSAAADAAVDVGANELSIVGADDTTYAGTMAGTGAFLNDGTGTLTLTGDGSGFTGILGATNAGAELAITGTGTTAAAGVGSTAGATFTTDGGALLASNVVVGTDGQVTFTGSEEIGALINSAATGNAGGTVTLTGVGTVLTVNGSANALNPGNFNGTNGTIDGDGSLNVTGGTFSVGVTGDVQTATTIGSGGTVINDGMMAGIVNAGTVINDGTVGGVDNSGTFNMLNGSSATGAFDNSNLVTLVGAASIGGALTNSALIDLSAADNGTGETLTVASLTSNAGNTVRVDLDVSTTTGASDKLLVTGASNGSTVVDFSNTSQYGAIAGNTLVLGNVAAASETGLNRNFGLVEYDFQKIGNDYFVTSQLSLAPIGGIVGGISTAQSLINAAVNRPSSAFVTTPIDVEADTCAPGGYGRLFGGASNAKASTTAANQGSAESEVDLTYGGAQIGVDFGCFNIKDTGASVNVGILAGLNTGKATQDQNIGNGATLLSDNDFDSRYLGIYATYVKESFFADAQVTFDSTSFDITSKLKNGMGTQFLVDNQSPDSDRFTLSGSAGYAFAFDDVSVVPSAGFAYSRTKTDSISLVTNNGQLTFDDLDTFIGFASVAVAKTIILPNETSAIQPFVTATIYNDFGNDQQVTYSDDINNPVLTTTENIGTFGELSLGMNYRSILDPADTKLREFSASVRGDLTFSERLIGGRITGQFRLQF